MTEAQAYTVASIVEKETIYEAEKKTIAGVYLNRLKTGMKLQADPTVVFALGIFGIQRILFEHLSTNSPYNTYLVNGLPPGPICMPSQTSLDAVINSEEHDFLFFCAKPGYDGSHSFAKKLPSS
ncbi:MAG: endolytic transglycosylase MltG [Saprospiraceae bacterium]|nr:endolytic transglycosylase MltG [Saprospiraceae bacterium]